MDSRGGTMIIQDVMITYDRRTKVFKFYADGRQVEVTGDMAYYRVCLLLQNAMKEGACEKQDYTR